MPEAEMEDEKLHEHCFRFPPNFDTGGFFWHPVGRLLLGGGEAEPTTIVRVYFGPKGVIMFVPNSAIARGHIILLRDHDEEAIGIFSK